MSRLFNIGNNHSSYIGINCVPTNLNQLVKYNLDDVHFRAGGAASFSINANVAEVMLPKNSASYNSFCAMQPTATKPAIANHKYLISIEIKTNYDLDDKIIPIRGVYRYRGSSSKILNNYTNQWHRYGALATGYETGQDYGISLFSSYGVSRSADVIGYLRNFMIVDLTAICGSGNEPTTVENAYAFLNSKGLSMSRYLKYRDFT